MTVEPRVEDPNDQFPVGMRVLAVDDDPTCLRLLDSLLRRCQYHGFPVTTTSQAITALKMLRENKNQFDLVISDVHMPDMDGFKLLELVGLEMDLPVIMLSANDDTKLVMKGITHGAVDYLLKPVRIEQLKNIWQHVIRRKRFDSRDQNNFDSRDKCRQGSGEGGQGSNEAGHSDHGKLNKKRKDQNEDDDEENDENGPDNEDPSTQKKPRVVWSVELHRKFVAAVNQLGIDRAVPKKILDLMNVEKLTRENVASHLQKYRLYLKRISCVANQQANMVAALGNTDSPYLMSSLSSLGNFYNISGSGQLPNSNFRSFPPSGLLGRLNTSSGMGMHCLSSSEMVQRGHLPNSSNPINNGGKLQPVLIPGNQNGVILQGMPMSLELEQLQHNKGIIHAEQLSNTIGDSTVFPASSSFSDTKMNSSRSSSSLLCATNSPLMLQGHSQENQRRGGLPNQSSATLLNTELPSSFPDQGRCKENWSTAVQPSGIQSSSFPLNDCFKQATLHPSSLRDNSPLVTLQSRTNLHDVSCVTSIHPLQGSKINLECQAMTIPSNSGKTMNYSTKVWGDHKANLSRHSSLGSSSTNTLIPAPSAIGTFEQGFEPKNTISDRNMDFNLIGESNFITSLPMQQNAVEESASDTVLQLKQGCTMGPRKPQSSYTSNNVGSLEDLVSAMMKRDQDKATLMEGDFGYDAYSLGTCL